MIGLEGIRVDDPGPVGAAWDEALLRRPAGRVDALTDPEVPPLPPHITFEQAKHLHERAARAATRTRAG